MEEEIASGDLSVQITRYTDELGHEEFWVSVSGVVSGEKAEVEIVIEDSYPTLHLAIQALEGMDLAWAE